MISYREESPSDFGTEISSIFSEDGLLSRAGKFEYRAEQQTMAVAVAETLMSRRHLVVEAGTGVGKSLAYLIPAILFAKRHKRRAIISTHTINLQEQLIQKDIPLVQRLLPIEFEAVLVKGRQNFVCPNRLDRAVRNAESLFTGPETAELQRLAEWSKRTQDGSLSDLDIEPDPKVWSLVCSEAHICTPKTCASGRPCHYQALRKAMQAADVLVVNHTLFFMHLVGLESAGTRGEGYLFANDFVIFDEAHTVEQVAAQQIGTGISQYGLRNALQRLYNPRTKKGLWTVLKNSDGVVQTAEMLDACEAFFSSVESKADFNKGREYRVREVDFVPDTLSNKLANLQQAVVEQVRKMEDDPVRSELQDLGRRIRDAREGLDVFLSQNCEGHVYWIERTGKTGASLALNASPIDIAAWLRQMLFTEGRTCVMTSATLGIGKEDLSYFRNRVGAEDARAVQVGSPFDYERQMRIFVPRKMPDPREEGYEEALAKWVIKLIEQTEGGAFVLFTSYRVMEALATRVRPWIDEKGWPFFVQGDGLPRSRMLSEFKATNNGVLFGTDSFWAGVDVPGQSLRNVIITRLPFGVPDHPLIEARLELIEARGGDAFQDFSMPEAILKFRQGVGRLIRTKTDSGVIAVLDNRIVTKSYGKRFLAALPKCPLEIL